MQTCVKFVKNSENRKHLGTLYRFKESVTVSLKRGFDCDCAILRIGAYKNSLSCTDKDLGFLELAVKGRASLTFCTYMHPACEFIASFADLFVPRPFRSLLDLNYASLHLLYEAFNYRAFVIKRPMSYSSSFFTKP